ncbi:PAS domain-containing protein [Novipirellula artificiosorum]|uniref:histidine kinase n=1 Tax=Novipirellula artificiosorum TaxID=2528016 RepID=A0A5C6DC58_9BACT|nr:PAS domain-containing protein [Novipirellula artificiosorum]TWU34278.1 Autoinducer 2 sensor kinase/phosphatase LuxQ [Novipirellula artificiosorum]
MTSINSKKVFLDSLSDPSKAALDRPDANLPLLNTYDQLLNLHMPPSMLISESNRILHVFAGATQFLRPIGSRVSNNVADQVHADIRVPLVTAVQRAKREQTTVNVAGLRLERPDGPLNLKLLVRPLQDPATSEKSFLIEFDVRDGIETPPQSAAEPEVELAATEDVAAREEELCGAHARVKASIEQLQSTNQELVASNQELQHANEKLHRVKGELLTANAEFQRKIAELTELTDDMDNLLNSTHVDTIFLDRQLKVRKFTPDITRIFSGIRQNVGRGIENCTCNLDNDQLVQEIRQVLRSEAPYEREVRDRKGYIFLMRILPYVSRGSVDGVVLTLIDITSLRQAESQLAELSDIVRQSDDAVFRVDSAGMIRSWNAGAEQLYGRTKQIIGQHLSLLVHMDQRKEVLGVLNSLTNSQTVQRIQTQHLREDGVTVDVAVSISPIRNDRGDMVAASVIARDISDRVRAEDEIRDAVRQRDRFLAMLSHELRNPLGAIVNAARLIAATTEGEVNQKRATEVVIQQSDQMSRLLDDLLDVSRVTLGKIELKRKTFDLVETVQEAVRALEDSFKQYELELSFDCYEGSLFIDGDPVRLQQVVVNLLRNASKYTPAGGKVSLTIRRDANEVEIRVKDTGVGIANEMIPEIFEMFVQTNNTLERSQGGIGVGLTLVKAIVEMHDGSVEVFSHGQGRGSEFRVRLPLTLTPDPAEVASPSITAASRTGNINSIVVVEDIQDAREMLEGILQLQGFSVKSAEDGPSGLRLIESEMPDLALVDIGLPGIDGYEIARQLRKKQSTMSIYLVALTGYGQASDHQAVLDAGFDDHLVKPLRIDDLDRILLRHSDPSRV